ncbi:MAG: response regulator [bacterium]|nr:response regulator [bacterium]
MTKKILIIEDDANLLYGLQAKFRVAGFITAADQGVNQAEPMEKIKTFKPDYIILDLILPKIDGFNLLSEIKANQETSGIMVFVFTNLSDRDSRERAEKLGADFYLIKTDINLDDFVAKFKKIIARAES